jgi:hypothetical protein
VSIRDIPPRRNLMFDNTYSSSSRTGGNEVRRGRGMSQARKGRDGRGFAIRSWARIKLLNRHQGEGVVHMLGVRGRMME